MASPKFMSAASPLPFAVVSSVAGPLFSATRKRRRDNDGIGIEEGCTNAVALDHPPDIIASDHIVSAAAHAAAQPIVTVRQTSLAKRPQLKYDPSIPMTKEAASAWRREQRRKRNRESAAACRKRQRDRISELELEVEGWRQKFDEALGKLKGVDGLGAKEVEAGLEGELATLMARPDASGVPPAPEGKTEQSCRTPPNVPEAIISVTDGPDGTPRVISPCQRHKLDSVPSASAATISPTSQVTPSESFHDLHFPLFEDPLLFKTTHNPQGFTIASSDSMLPRVENRTHLNDVITRQATSRLRTAPSLRRLVDGFRSGFWLLNR